MTGGGGGREGGESRGCERMTVVSEQTTLRKDSSDSARTSVCVGPG